jgi:UDP-glucuronate 4-epimerase
MASVLVTGGAGFIGSHVVEALLARGDEVCILDSLDPFYAVASKEANLARIFERGDARVVRGDLRDASAVAEAAAGVDAVIHLAALAGVRPSIERPADYWDVNLLGTQRVLDAIAGRANVRFVFGSSSSIYGGRETVPFHEDDSVGQPVSPYAATKRAGELCCHAFHVLNGNPVSCLRFFTVYGPRQRPEMAIHKFTRMIENGEAVPMFGDGLSSRDYTYVDDIVAGVLAALDRCGEPAGFRIYNLGGDGTTTLADLVACVGKGLGKEPKIERLPDQPGDVPRTAADVSRAREELGFEPRTAVSEGVPRFVTWYRASRAAGEVE